MGMDPCLEKIRSSIPLVLPGEKINVSLALFILGLDPIKDFHITEYKLRARKRRLHNIINQSSDTKIMQKTMRDLIDIAYKVISHNQVLYQDAQYKVVKEMDDAMHRKNGTGRYKRIKSMTPEHQKRKCRKERRAKRRESRRGS